MRNRLYPRLARQSLRKNRRFYLPYLLSVAFTFAAFYVMAALAADPGTRALRGAEYVRVTMAIGLVVAGLFSAVLLLYLNSFLMKQRRQELGLYSVLGMSKKNLAALLCWESFYAALIGMGGGLVLGLALHRGATAALLALLRFSIPFSSALSLPAAGRSVLVFGALLALSLLVNLVQVGRSQSVALLRSASAGERDPRARLPLAVLGLASLGAGYAIAVTTTDGFTALSLYFLAVILVIIGTYCLFTAGSITLLRALRRNKRFYYQTSHFIGVSGMLYRMRRNAVGLASICILSTMVMVMVSGTLSLYLGTGKIIDARYPSDLQLEARYAGDQADPFRGDDLTALAAGFFAENGADVTALRTVTYLSFSISRDEGGWAVRTAGPKEAGYTVYFITARDYAGFTGLAAPALAPGQAAVCGEGLPLGPLTLTARGAGALTLDLSAALPAVDFFAATFDRDPTVCLVLPDEAALAAVYALQRPVMDRDYRFIALLDLACTPQQALTLKGEWLRRAGSADLGGYDFLSSSFRADAAVDGYGSAGGFLFLGLLLGGIFLAATALIIYYKQLGEGYEDQRRFAIMRQVGLTQEEIRACVRSQVLLVFFLPMLAAALHLLFDFNLVVRLLTLFSLRDVPLTAACTGATLLAFCAVYALVYLLTARTYYKIVR